MCDLDAEQLSEPHSCWLIIHSECVSQARMLSSSELLRSISLRRRVPQALEVQRWKFNVQRAKRRTFNFQHRTSNGGIPVEADLIGPTNYLRDKPNCPSGGADYFTTIGQVDQIATCTIASVEGHTL